MRSDDEGSRPAPDQVETVLVVEDEAAVRTLVHELLTSRGYRVLTASDAAVATSIAESEPALDALIVDVFIPGGGGLPLVRRLRERHPRAAVVVVSGAGDEPAGEDDVRFLAKPFNGSKLIAALAEALAARPA